MKRIFTLTLALIISVAALADNKEDLTKLNEIIANPNTTEEVRQRAINNAVEIIETIDDEMQQVSYYIALAISKECGSQITED